MLFIDNAGGRFHRSVQTLVSKVFPKRTLVVIPNEDPIYRQPYRFPDGAPPLWHHSGDRALGVQIDGRWAVFYHQGDIHDAWKTGHSGVSKKVAEMAYKLGINVMFYAHATAQPQDNTKKAAEPTDAPDKE